MTDYWTWVKNNILVVYPNLQDKSLLKKQWFHRHNRVVISDRYAGDVKLCLGCGEVTITCWTTGETRILGYVDPRKDGVYSGLLGTKPTYLKNPTTKDFRAREKEANDYFAVYTKERWG